MPKRSLRRERKRPTGRRLIRALTAIGVLAVLTASLWWLHSINPGSGNPDAKGIIDQAQPVPSPPIEELTDEKLQRAADQLLALIDPERPENEYVSDYAQDHLRWMVREHGAGRLDVAFLLDASNGSLPPDVLMAAWELGDKPAIVIAKPTSPRLE